MPTDDLKTHDHNFFLGILMIGSIVTMIVSFYSFYFQKNFDYIVETSCDQTTQTCFYRDCSIEDNCPPNELSYYKTYTIQAKDFNKCENEDCTAVCTQGIIQCEEISCTEDDLQSGVCIAPEIN